MMKQILRLLILTLFATLPLSHGWAQETVHQKAKRESNVTIRMLAERDSVEAGDEIWIGIEQSIRPEWHTYWKNPGDSGSPPAVTWMLPDGFEISDVYWPTPKKIPYPPLLNYGYETGAILLQKLKIPNTLPEGTIELKATVDILVCKEECIPEYGTYILSLNDSDANAEDNKAYIDNARIRLPQKVSWNTKFKEDTNGFKLTITPSNNKIFEGLTPENIEFFPTDWGLINNAAKPTISLENNQIIITQKRGDRSLNEFKTTNIVLALGKGENRLSYELKAEREAPVFIAEEETPEEITPQTIKTPAPQINETSYLGAILLALLGGMILNLMPCVFPVLSLKALSLFKIAEKHPEQARIHGLSYTSGIILSFLAIAGVLIALQSAGAGVGWGFQLQNPIIVGALAYLLFVIGLGLFGFFEFGANLTNTGDSLTKGHGYKSSFFTGILATIVATPCTAPFMAAAIGYALLQPPIINLSIFAALGLGLALPYLVLSFSPKLEKMLPKPGAWMNTFKQIMAFPMFLSAAWLVWVLSRQSGSTAVLYALVGMILITFALWIIHHITSHQKAWTRAVAIIAVIAAFLLLGITPSGQPDTAPTEKTKTATAPSNWEIPYTAAALETALQTKNPVFVEMTAAWCITCKVNHATSINIDSTKKLFKEHNVQYLLGDWTNQDAEITKYLNLYGRNGVPIYVFYGKPDENGKRPDPITLPQILTPGIIKKTIKGENK